MAMIGFTDSPGRGRACSAGPALLLRAVFLLCSAMAPAMGMGEEKPETIRVSGVVRLVGSSPGTELLLSNESREWYIEAKDRDKLWNFQQRSVVVEGEEKIELLRLADGRPGGERRYLLNIRIIETDGAEGHFSK
jgi:hypothetical protein